MAYERITIDPAKMTGLPCIRDTRVTVSAVLGQLAAGRSTEQILADYPYLERADILAALEFAAAAVQERELPLARPGQICYRDAASQLSAVPPRLATSGWRNRQTR